MRLIAVQSHLNIVNDHCQPVSLFKSVWVKNKNVHKVWEHILDSIDFISSYIIVFCFYLTRGGRLIKQTEGDETLCLRRQWDTGHRILGPFPYLQISLITSLMDNNFFEINQLLNFFVIADAEE